MGCSFWLAAGTHGLSELNVFPFDLEFEVLTRGRVINSLATGQTAKHPNVYDRT